MEDVQLAEITPLWPASFGFDEVRAAALVRQAQLKILSRIPSIPARIDSGELNRELLVGVIADVVLRRLNSPEDGAKGDSYGAMDYTYSRQFDSSSRLWLSDADLVDLLPSAASGGAVIGQMGLGLRPWQVPMRGGVGW